MKERNKIFELPKRAGPDCFNVKELRCPKECEIESFTIKINRRPEMVKWATYVYRISCNQCGGIIAEQPFDNESKT